MSLLGLALLIISGYKYGTNASRCFVAQRSLQAGRPRPDQDEAGRTRRRGTADGSRVPEKSEKWRVLYRASAVLRQHSTGSRASTREEHLICNLGNDQFLVAVAIFCSRAVLVAKEQVASLAIGRGAV